MAVCHEIFNWPEMANWGAINFMGGVAGFQMASCGALSAAATALGMMFGKDADTGEQVSKARKKTRAAALLGITRATLYAKVKQYSIEKDLRASMDEDEVLASSFHEPATC